MGAKKGEKYRCKKCGLLVTVDEDCNCEVCDIVCCDEPLKKLGEETEEVTEEEASEESEEKAESDEE